MLAAAAGNLVAVQLLLAAGADIQKKELAREQTALMFAAAYNRVDVIKLLAHRGADLRAASKVVDLYELTRDEASDAGASRSVPGGSGAPAAPAAPRRSQV